MTRFNSTAILLFLVCSVFTISCKKFPEANVYTNTIQLSPTNVVPANTSTASGTMDVSYNDLTKQMTYTVNWTGLSGTISSNGIHIHGLADPGTIAMPPPLGLYPNGIAQSISVSTANNTPAAGSISGSLFVDEVVIKEADLLAGKFYVDIHTAAHTAGQLRGQITFNK